MSTSNEVIGKLPKEIMEKALTLRNSVRTIFIELYVANKPLSADDLAKVVGHARAYVNMRLNQLEDMGYIVANPCPTQKKIKLYEVAQ